MPVRNLLIVILAAVLSMACYEKAQRNRYASGISEAMSLITSNYVEEVSERELYENAMRGLVEGLDEYSTYISQGDYQQLREDLDQKFGGIGIIVELNPQTRRLLVMSPLAGTPAYRAGMRAGDVILRIGEHDTEGMSLKDAVELMRGDVGTPVHLTVMHAGQTTPVEFTVERAIIPIESVLGDTHHPDGSWNFRLEENPRITYVRLNNFGEKTVEELHEALKTDSDGADLEALILDVRRNPGGLLEAAVGVCQTFVGDDKPIVTIRGRDAVIQRQYNAKDRATVPESVPMVVLIDKYSASASEIVAACLQDHGRAVAVGDRTWGKGTVQNIIPIEGGDSALRLTTASYWRPSGQNIHRTEEATEEDQWGVRPDPGFEVKLTDKEFERVVLQRRRRDIYFGDAKRPDDGQSPEGGDTSEENGAPDESSGNGESGPSTTPEDSPTGESRDQAEEEVLDAPDGKLFDPQLLEAIEYLEKQLLKKDLAPRAA